MRQTSCLLFELARGAHLVFLLNCGKPHECGRARRCLIKFPMHEKRLPQFSHTYGLTPVCNDEWVTRLSRCAKDFPHICKYFQLIRDG